MARAVHRVSLRILPPLPEQELGSVRKELESGGFLTEDLRMGPQPMVEGPVGSVHWIEKENPWFLSSGLGGFRVRCPVAPHNLVGPFGRAMAGWRAGTGPRSLLCACGATHDLADLLFEPAAGFARCWLELRDVEQLELTEACAQLLRRIWGGFRLVVHRG